MFGAFIISCGTGHLMEVWTLWHPHYWLSGGLKAVMAGISVYTPVELVPLRPRALALPSPVQLEETNQILLKEVTLALLQAEARLQEYFAIFVQQEGGGEIFSFQMEKRYQTRAQ